MLADTEESGVGVEETDCAGKAWYSAAPVMEATVMWTAPACDEGTEVTVYGTVAAGSTDSYKTAEVRMVLHLTVFCICCCGDACVTTATDVLCKQSL
jgi:hypothetical protein